MSQASSGDETMTLIRNNLKQNKKGVFEKDTLCSSSD